MRDREQEVEDLIEAGRINEAVSLCEALAGYYDDEERANRDRAGEYAVGGGASRRADYWRNRARELRQTNAT
jgi:hypothetical protein